MQNLGRTEAELYPSMTEDKSSKKIHYPGINLPISMLPENADLGGEISVTLKGKITRIEKSEYANEFSIDAMEGEVV